MPDAMVQMSRAIRHVIEDNSTANDLSGLPTETLRDFTQILGAFWTDLKDELERRNDA